MLKKTSEKFEGNDKYEGFAVDLAEQIATIVGFNYSIVPTNGHGSVDANGQWNGMIKELLEEVNIIYFNYVRTYLRVHGWSKMSTFTANPPLIRFNLTKTSLSSTIC